jgi:hypothetical protein
MGTAGIKPNGDDHFSTSFETWIDWRRVTAPGYAFLYTYWMDMERDKDGHFWATCSVRKKRNVFCPSAAAGTASR